MYSSELQKKLDECSELQVVGFTGTRNGMSAEQLEGVKRILEILSQKLDFVGLHGDCIGADADFDSMCKEVESKTRIRPCTFENIRAYCESEEISEPKRPMQRNRDIVADANIMIACPPNDVEIKKGSGTWATIKFSRKAKKLLFIVFPDGKCSIENTAENQEVMRILGSAERV